MYKPVGNGRYLFRRLGVKYKESTKVHGMANTKCQKKHYGLTVEQSLAAKY